MKTRHILIALRGIVHLEYADYLNDGQQGWGGDKTRRGVKRLYYALFNDGKTQENYYLPDRLGEPGKAAFLTLMEKVKGQPMVNVHLYGHNVDWWPVLGREENADY